MDEMERIKICTGYRYKGKIYKDFPADTDVLSSCEPVYEEHDGWQGDTSSIARYKDLPKNAKAYLSRMSKLLDVKIGMVSVGSERRQAFKVAR